MVTCGGQATIPVVAAIAATTPVRYAEIVASIASKSAGPGTPASIDEFTETTAKALEVVGGANRAKAIIVLNPADPPPIMRDTVHCLIGEADVEAVERGVVAMVDAVASYVPGYSGCSSAGSRPTTRPRTWSTLDTPARSGRCRCTWKSRAPPIICPPTPGTSTS